MAKKDVMHFEYLPYQEDVKRRQQKLGLEDPEPRVAALEETNKFLNSLRELIKESKEEVDYELVQEKV